LPVIAVARRELFRHGRLSLRIATQKGRAAGQSLNRGICGEHGGNSASIASCAEVGQDYVSFTPYRLRTAHLAAVQAALT
jgi:pyruvate,orthophosphate dikinase